ncbi:MAG: site-specific integrase [Streptococcaceae bacterium]|jgi:integrase|nr:site-specific integrase [Streptococcaceae bacterium]
MKKRKDNKGRILLKGESQRPDGRYMYRYTDLNGVRYTEYSWRLVETDPLPKGKKSELSLREIEKRVAQDSSDFITYEAGKMNMNDLFVRYTTLRMKLNKMSPNTYFNYSSIWNKHIKDHGFTRINISDLRKSDVLNLYQDLLNNQVGKGSIILMHKVINALLNYAVSEDYIRKNYAKGCTKELEIFNGNRKSLTVEEHNSFLNFVSKHHKYGSLYWTFVFMFETAVRISELAGLTNAEVNEEHGTITIDHQLIYVSDLEKNRELRIRPPKTFKSIRLVSLSKRAKEALKEQRKLLERMGMTENYEVDNHKDFLFLDLKGRLLTVTKMLQYLKVIVKEFNAYEKVYAKRDNREPKYLPNITSHILRHTGCTRLAELGMDIRTLQEVMGHSSINVTMRVYNHVDEVRMQSEFERIDRIREEQGIIQA